MMLPGRVGDTPFIGCGVYADNISGAVSMTGLGEGIIRLAVAKQICDHYAGSRSGRRRADRFADAGGARSGSGRRVGPDSGRAICDRHVTPRMAAGWWDGRGEPAVKGRFR